MAYSQLDIKGYRGFGKTQTLYLAKPNGKEGSGLTVIVGPNNSGKSTIYEAFKSVSQHQPPSFTEGRRNKKYDDRIQIRIYEEPTKYLTLQTVEIGGSETMFVDNGLPKNQVKIFALPSRRTFNPYFSKGIYTRESFMQNMALPTIRGSQLQGFEYRLFKIQESKPQLEQFNSVLNRVLDPIPDWFIEQNDTGQYYIKFNYSGIFHNSDGAGEGLVSAFTIIDALYDSQENDTIVIDEPELSLHPSLQKKLANVILEYSSSKQIIISTHSPYFINWVSILNGGKLARTNKSSNGDLEIHQLKDETAMSLCTLLDNYNNPHILGLDAKEMFFLEDKVIFVEGQEDVIFFRKIFSALNLNVKGTFYGWGAGGAHNIEKLLKVFRDLGFSRCIVILDNNKKELQEPLSNQFKDFKIITIPTDDVRDKPAVLPKAEIHGLIDSGGKNIKEEYIASIKDIVSNVNEYFNAEANRTLKHTCQ